jgi:translation initiation factor 2-alpha kinase 4
VFSFDIVSPLRSSAAEAELLDVVDKMILEFRGMKGAGQNEYEFHVNHESGRLFLTFFGIVSAH